MSIRRIILAIGVVIALYQLHKAAKATCASQPPVKTTGEPADVWVTMAMSTDARCQAARRALERRIDNLITEDS
jgi:hypothetical protein